MSDKSDPLDALSPEYAPAFVFGLSIQVALFFVAASELDNGRTVGEMKLAILCQTLASIVIVGRRLSSPLRNDLTFIRWGILAVWAVVILASPLAAEVRGREILGRSDSLAGFYCGRVLNAGCNLALAAVPWSLLWGICLLVGRSVRALTGGTNQASETPPPDAR